MRRARPAAAVATRIACWIALSLAAAPAVAHGPEPGSSGGELDAQLDALPPELDGLAVQIHRTVAPQLVLENRTGRVLEVLDGQGLAFLRIGPEGVHGNLAAPAWYRSLAPEAGTVPPEVAERARSGEPVPPRWVPVKRGPSWGWFDERLEARPGTHRAGHGEAKPRWEVPVRLGDTASALRGRFVERPAPTGTLRARLRSDGQLAPGVRISLLPGRPGSFFLKSESQQVVTVLGSDGEPFLRFGAFGVEANLHSPTYSEVARLRGTAADPVESGDAEGRPGWRSLSPVPSYGWVDPRTTPAEGRVPVDAGGTGQRVELLEWRLPVRVGSGEDAVLVHVEGVTAWEPFQAVAEPATGDGAGG